MDLLNETKKVWLLSYIIITGFVLMVYLFCFDSEAGKTIVCMLTLTQFIMLAEFLIIVWFKWIVGCRVIASVLFLTLVIYCGAKRHIQKWYIIIPAFILSYIYMMWNLGGIKNCIIASPYKAKLDNLVSECKLAYRQYSCGVDEFKVSNGTDALSWVYKKKEPDWDSYDIDGLGMFCVEVALIGMDRWYWDYKVAKIESLNKELDIKNQVLNSDISIKQEVEMLENIKSKTDCIRNLNVDLNSQINKLKKIKKDNAKKARKILNMRFCKVFNKGVSK